MTEVLAIDEGSPRITLCGIVGHIQPVASLSQQSICTLIVPHLIKCPQELDDGWRLSAILDGNRLLTPLGVDVLGLQACGQKEAQQQGKYKQYSFHKNLFYKRLQYSNIFR
jgi:hypothetical protein